MMAGENSNLHYWTNRISIVLVDTPLALKRDLEVTGVEFVSVLVNGNLLQRN